MNPVFEGKIIRNVIYFFVMAWAFLGISSWLPGWHVEGWGPAIFASLVLAFANTVVKPLLFLMTLPLTIMTLGFFLLVLNALMVWLTALLVPGFAVTGLVPLFVGSLLLALLGVAWKALSRSE